MPLTLYMWAVENDPQSDFVRIIDENNNIYIVYRGDVVSDTLAPRLLVNMQYARLIGHKDESHEREE